MSLNKYFDRFENISGVEFKPKAGYRIRIFGSEYVDSLTYISSTDGWLLLGTNVSACYGQLSDFEHEFEIVKESVECKFNSNAMEELIK